MLHVHFDQIDVICDFIVSDLGILLSILFPSLSLFIIKQCDRRNNHLHCHYFFTAYIMHALTFGLATHVCFLI